MRQRVTVRIGFESAVDFAYLGHFLSSAVQFGDLCGPEERLGIRVGRARRIGSLIAAEENSRSRAVAAIWSNGVRTEVRGTGSRCASGMSL